MGMATLAGGFAWTLAINETDTAGECDFCILQHPPTITINAGQSTPMIFGRIFEAGVTESIGAPMGVIAEVGVAPQVVGPPGADPRAQNNWVWLPMVFNVQVGNDDEFMGAFFMPTAGNFVYATRFSLDGGLTWSYADTDGAGSNMGLDFDPSLLGTLMVQ